MMNNVSLVGRLGADPETRETRGGQKVTNFRMAVGNSYTNAAGEEVDKTVWFRVTCWGDLGSQVAAHLSKGRQVSVVGEIAPAQGYLAKNGDIMATNEITARDVRFLDPRPDGTAKPDATADLPF